MSSPTILLAIALARGDDCNFGPTHHSHLTLPRAASRDACKKQHATFFLSHGSDSRFLLLRRRERRLRRFRHDVLGEASCAPVAVDLRCLAKSVAFTIYLRTVRPYAPLRKYAYIPV